MSGRLIWEQSNGNPLADLCIGIIRDGVIGWLSAFQRSPVASPAPAAGTASIRNDI
jgi:hypothetical protein